MCHSHHLPALRHSRCHYPLRGKGAVECWLVPGGIDWLVIPREGERKNWQSTYLKLGSRETTVFTILCREHMNHGMRLGGVTNYEEREEMKLARSA